MNDDGIEIPTIIVHDVESALAKLVDDLEICELLGIESVKIGKLLERLDPIAIAVSAQNREALKEGVA